MTNNKHENLITMTNDQLLTSLFTNRLINNNKKCSFCLIDIFIKKTNKTIVHFWWRCVNFKCLK